MLFTDNLSTQQLCQAIEQLFTNSLTRLLLNMQGKYYKWQVIFNCQMFRIAAEHERMAELEEKERELAEEQRRAHV
jgi:hypothetical protein